MTYTKEICQVSEECFYGKMKIYRPGRVTRVRFIAYDGSLSPAYVSFRSKAQLEQILAGITTSSLL